MNDNNETISLDSLSPKALEQLSKIVKDEEAQNKRTYKYYQTIRKDSLDKFLGTEVQKAMEADAQALGERFYD